MYFTFFRPVLLSSNVLIEKRFGTKSVLVCLDSELTVYVTNDHFMGIFTLHIGP